LLCALEINSCKIKNSAVVVSKLSVQNAFLDLATHLVEIRQILDLFAIQLLLQKIRGVSGPTSTRGKIGLSCVSLGTS